ncbi:MAG: 1-deoxy-D-xylulose-5-phosphate reductoisomerase [Candidatus Sumerlaeota bacterium]|nr:1-deoxy-D-xylulose-5-phosphate reductoisomerase [Candidatus Sumerlaeota bacterium]
MKRIAILGSTGSIGVKALEVIQDFPDYLCVVALSARSRVDLLTEQAVRFNPDIINVTRATEEIPLLKKRFSGRVTRGPEGLVELVRETQADLLLVATVGAAGIYPTLAAIERGLTVALANKEVLVTAGRIVMSRAREKGVRVLPVDSEHNAVAQCLMGEKMESVRRLILTASGGPFRDWDPKRAAEASVEEALAHPTWNMGPKITIDSATMMNKGFEVIEAQWLFGLPLDKIQVVIHRQSLIHSMVEFCDGSVIAQMGPADMYYPIQNILLHPERVANKHSPLDFAALGALTFEEISLERFPCLRLAFEAARAGGTAPAALNAANEVAVEAFLAGGIRFGAIPRIIEEVLSQHKVTSGESLEEIEVADAHARAIAAKIIAKLQ